MWERLEVRVIFYFNIILNFYRERTSPIWREWNVEPVLRDRGYTNDLLLESICINGIYLNFSRVYN